MLSLAACAPTGAADEKPPRSAPHTASSSTSADTDAVAGEGPLTAAPQATAEPATVEGAIGETIDLDTGISVSVDAVTPVQVEAKTPGEVSGSAVVVDVTATNGSKSVQDIAHAVVSLSAADGEFGVATTAGDPAFLTGDLDPGDTATGRYVFMLDDADARAVVVSVSYAGGAPVAIFTGKAS